MNPVLVVDDDRDLLNLYVDFLEEMGFQVVSAQDGATALKLAVEIKPELIITDWQMPGMDGVELSKALRHSLPPGSTRILLHSSERVPESGGADMCLRKPGSFEAFKAVIESLLSSPRKRTEDSAPRAPVRVLHHGMTRGVEQDPQARRMPVAPEAEMQCLKSELPAGHLHVGY